MSDELLELKKIFQKTKKTSFLFRKKKFISRLDECFEYYTKTLQITVDNLKEKEQECIKLIDDNHQYHELNEDLSSTLERREKKIKRREKELSTTIEKVEGLEKGNSILIAEKDELNTQLANISKDYELANDTAVRNEYKYKCVKKELETEQLSKKIIAALIEAKNENENFRNFQECLRNNFMDFASQESSLPDEAQKLLELQTIEDELRLISACPAFYTKKIIAVGGGFSAGKSEFISSFFDDKTIKLPSNMEETTAIPVYVVSDENSENSNQLIGVNPHGGVVNLSTLKLEGITQENESIHNRLTHQFMNSFGFPIKKLMPHMFLSTKLGYKNICLLDTPGYNAAKKANGSTNDDREIAQSYLNDAEAIIWVLDITAGTIPQSDIEFLRAINKDRKPLYLVLNKADLRINIKKNKKGKIDIGDVVNILSHIKSILKDKYISYEGISVFSSLFGDNTGKEYYYDKISLYSFIQKLDKPSNKHQDIVDRLYQIEHAYYAALQRDIKIYQHFEHTLSTISMKLYCDGYQDGESSVYNCLSDMVDHFSTSKLEKQVKQLKKIFNQLVASVNKLFNSSEKFSRPVFYEEDIELPNFSDIDFDEKNADQLDEDESEAFINLYDKMFGNQGAPNDPLTAE